MLDRILCFTGIHGPNWTVDDYFEGPRSIRTAAFERTCPSCKAVWHGREVKTSTQRTVGGWRKAK